MPHDVTMPQLGMAQDAGRIIAWLKKPGDKIAQGDALFEVETDKATMEVEAQFGGYLTNIAAAEGDDVPVGQVIARISETAEAAPEPEPETIAIKAHRAPEMASGGTPSTAARASTEPEHEPKTVRPAASTPPASANGRILASPKARRLALAQGLDLARLVAAGVPQPIHVRDLETWSATAPTGSAVATSAPVRRLTCDTAQDGFTPFAEWAAETAGITGATTLLVGFAAASLRRAAAVPGAICVAVAEPGNDRSYPDADRASLGRAAPASDAPPPMLVLRDLRLARITAVELGVASAPVLTIMTRGGGLSVTLEWAEGQISQQAAIDLVEGLAGRLEEPLRHLL